MPVALTPEGNFKVTSASVIGHWLIYISPFNSAVREDDISPLVDLEIIGDTPIPNVAPIILQPGKIEVKASDTAEDTQAEVITVSLPEVYDANEDDYTITVEGLVDGVEYLASTHSLAIDLSKFQGVNTTLNVVLILTDSNEASSTYTIPVSIQGPVQEKEKVETPAAIEQERAEIESTNSAFELQHFMKPPKTEGQELSTEEIDPISLVVSNFGIDGSLLLLFSE